MKILLQNILTGLLFLTAMPITAQVLWSDDFDSYPVGLLSTDPTGINPGYGNWYVTTPNSEIRIVAEAGRGNVMVKGWAQHTGGSSGESAFQENIDVLWNSRDKSNNILKLEFEMYVASFPSSLNGYMIDYINVKGKNDPFSNQFRCWVNKNGSSIGGGSNGSTYNHHWIKVEMYIDYNTNILYYHVPNHFTEKETKNSIEEPAQIILSTYFNGTFLGSGALIKYDNFKVSAIPALPNYLSVDDFVSSKFSVFPNPATDIVMITNSENIGIKQVEVFDVSGKIIKSKNFNSENEVLLNIGDFGAGMYLLYIKTSEGKAVKKMVKK